MKLPAGGEVIDTLLSQLTSNDEDQPADAISTTLAETEINQAENPAFDASQYLRATTANYVIFGSCALALFYAYYCYRALLKIEMTKDTLKVAPLSDAERDEIQAMQHRRMPPQTQEEAFEEMKKIAELIRSGSDEFLKKEYTYLLIFCAIFAVVIYVSVDCPQGIGAAGYFPYTTIAFFIGVGTSMLCGWMGMSIATFANVRTTWACNTSIEEGFHVAF